MSSNIFCSYDTLCNVAMFAITTIAAEIAKLQLKLILYLLQLLHDVLWSLLMHLKFLKQAFHISMIVAMTTISDKGNL